MCFCADFVPCHRLLKGFSMSVAGGSGAAPILLGRCGVTWGWRCLPGGLCEMPVARVTWPLYVSQGSCLLKCLLWLGMGSLWRFEQCSLTWEYREVRMWWYQCLTLHPTFPTASPFPLQTPLSSSWVGRRRQLSSEPVRTSYPKQRLEQLILHHFCLLVTI